MLRQGFDGKAMNDFTRAIDLKADFSLAYHERAGIRRRMGDLQGALFDYKTAVDYRPDFPLALNNMGSVRILLGDFEGAVGDYSRALELDPGLYLALNNRGYALYFLGDLEGSLRDLDAAITLEDSFVEPRLNKSTVLVSQNLFEPALSLLSSTIGAHPAEALLYLNRGLVRELTGDLEGACQDWNRARELGVEEAGEYIGECN
ncbi:MAG: tetratricopeptide repeat protein [Bacteroidetes bacterium]|nr:MAG: tetratricopeptide repeat protein [Bacteroidota bacterium]